MINADKTTKRFPKGVLPNYRTSEIHQLMYKNHSLYDYTPKEYMEILDKNSKKLGLLGYKINDVATFLDDYQKIHGIVPIKNHFMLVKDEHIKSFSHKYRLIGKRWSNDLKGWIVYLDDVSYMKIPNHRKGKRVVEKDGIFTVQKYKAGKDNNWK